MQRLRPLAMLGTSALAMLSGMVSAVRLTRGMPMPFHIGRSPRDRRRERRSTYHVPNGAQECDRRRRNGGHHQQRLSHRPGSVQPRHIFGTP